MISRQKLYAMGEPLGDSATVRKLGGGYRCGFGGGSKSESTQTTSQQDNRIVNGNGGIVATTGADVSVLNNSYTTTTTSDPATVARALNTVDDTVHGAFSLVGSQNAALVRSVNAANQQAAASVSQATDALAGAYSDAKGNNNKGTFQIAAVVMAGLVALAVMEKHK